MDTTPAKARWAAATAAAIALYSALGGHVARALAEDAPPPASNAKDHTGRRPLAVEPGPVRGMILDADGKTPGAGATVRLRDATGRVVAQATSDGAGEFAIAVQPAGTYRIEIGRAAGHLVLREGAGARALALVIPREIALPIAPAKEGDDTDDDIGPTGIYWLDVVIVTAVGLVVAGGVVIGAIAVARKASSDDDGGKPPSPSQ